MSNNPAVEPENMIDEQDSVNDSAKADLKEVAPKPKKKRRRLRYFVIAVAVVGFVIYSAITIINQNVLISQKRTQLKELNEQINVYEIQAEYLENVQNLSGEDQKEYIEKIAKENGYVSDGERIFINVD